MLYQAVSCYIFRYYRTSKKVPLCKNSTELLYNIFILIKCYLFCTFLINDIIFRDMSDEEALTALRARNDTGSRAFVSEGRSINRDWHSNGQELQDHDEDYDSMCRRLEEHLQDLPACDVQVRKIIGNFAN